MMDQPSFDHETTPSAPTISKSIATPGRTSNWYPTQNRPPGAPALPLLTALSIFAFRFAPSTGVKFFVCAAAVVTIVSANAIAKSILGILYTTVLRFHEP